MSFPEKWSSLRLPVLGRADEVDDERLHKLFWNRAELKKELQALDDELRSLQNKVKQQDVAAARLEEQSQQLEVLLGTPERGPDALVHFALRNLWRECRKQLERFFDELRRQREDVERKRQLAQFKQDRDERLMLADQRLAEAAAVVEQERARLQEGEHKLASLTALWHYFRRRELAYELDAQRSRVAEAERHLGEMQEARRTIEKEPWPEFPGLSLPGRRGINLAVIAYAQLLCMRLAPRDLATQARQANHRRPQDARYGSRAECLARLDEVASAIAMVRQREGVGADLRAVTEDLKATVAWRGEADAVPMPGSLQPFGAGDGQPNILIDDYWDIYRILLR